MSEVEEGQVSSERGCGSEGEEFYDSDAEWTLRGSLPVAPIDASFDPQAAPLSGEEYLRLVRYQNALLPAAQAVEGVSTTEGLVDSQLTNFDEFTQIKTTTPSTRLPTAEWIRSFLTVFEQGCLPESDLDDDDPPSDWWPALGDEQGWRQYMYPLIASSPVPLAKRVKTLTHLEPDFFQGSLPSQRQIMQLLKYHLRWFNFLFPANVQRAYQWIMRLLQVLDRRVTGNQVSILRQLALQTMRLRMHYSIQDQEERIVFFLNGILVAIAYRFGQMDLV